MRGPAVGRARLGPGKPVSSDDGSFGGRARVSRWAGRGCLQGLQSKQASWLAGCWLCCALCVRVSLGMLGRIFCVGEWGAAGNQQDHGQPVTYARWPVTHRDGA